MDAHRRRLGLPLLNSHALILLIIASFYSRPASSVRSVISSSDEDKVKLELYYETLCPASAGFIHDYLYKMFANGIIDITNFKLVPYGNARIINGTVVCQHGEDECFFNLVEGCAITCWDDARKYFPFIYCLEDLVVKNEYFNWETCFDKLGLDRKPVHECLKSGKAKQLQALYAAQTNSLHPRKSYVPWVVVDGNPLYLDYEKYDVAICKAYKGKARSAVCNELVGVVDQKRKRNAIFPVCYEGLTINSIFSSIRSIARSWMQGVTTAAALA